jgi:hypothetical protein
MRRGEMEGVIKEAIRRAIAAAGSQKQLHALILPILRRPIQPGSISSWLREDKPAMPPADALLAMAKVTNLSLDELLFGESLTARQDRLEREVQDLRSLLEKPGPSSDGPR